MQSGVAKSSVAEKFLPGKVKTSIWQNKHQWQKAEKTTAAQENAREERYAWGLTENFTFMQTPMI